MAGKPKSAKPASAKPKGGKAAAPSRLETARKARLAKAMDAAEHEHRDPRAEHQDPHFAKSHGLPVGMQNQGNLKARGAGRMNVVVNWFRRAPKHKQ
jgi:hypothetical protein